MLRIIRKRSGVKRFTASRRHSAQAEPCKSEGKLAMNVLTAADRIAAAFPETLRRVLTRIRRRREEQRIAMLVEELGHPGLIADFRRASRG